ncbi:MAG: bifunctional 4-hydroxy-2-oxoglutarate aldolase/2-dehydro-3-deoxy-phosphogluconate aldolase [Chitinophagaceae bacterium]|jgi:2-dehydro-3-deoxyphosphogluconate aldolase/(4S)-4-hydroxy-2-oxoglutarate aldolase|nr:bifunctional 4-hydroxy-2-oxoglutarate aldolase/2-dehydro-3-deoxy-phosphogluconate aldolase [Chitinophagaceae bacterium]
MASKSSESLQLIAQQGFIPLYYFPDEKITLNILELLYNSGVRILEYTNRGANALSNFKKMIALRNEKLPGLHIAAGTVKTQEEATAFIAAGADFISSPGMIPEIGDMTRNNDMLWIPGCMTLTEIITAEKHGASLIKLFPANLLGAPFVGAIKEIFPKLKFIPTGGIGLDRDSIYSWLQIEAVIAVGLGSKVLSNPVMVTENYEEIKNRIRWAFSIIEGIRTAG